MPDPAARGAKRWSILLGVLGAIPIGAVAAGSLTVQAWQFLDPCVHWAPPGTSDGHGSKREGYFLPPGSLPADSAGPCSSRFTTIGQTKRQALTLMILVPGGLLMASVLAIFGVFTSKPRIIQWAALMLLVEVLPSFSLAQLTLAEAILCLLAAWQTRRFLRASPAGVYCG